MSASSSPHIAPAHLDHPRSKKRERPPALDLNPGEAPSADMGPPPQLRVQISVPDEPAPDSERDEPRSTSAASSSLDPYYFSERTPADSPLPPMPPPPGTLPRTPDALLHPAPPATPARNPQDIDRRGLVGVGELATPRWGRAERRQESADDAEREQPIKEEREDSEDDGLEVADENLDDEVAERDGSPWTIEAVDEARDEFKDEPEETPKEEPAQTRRSAPRTIRPSRSMASESGGEEILYPRKPQAMDVFHQPKLPERQPRGSPPVVPSSEPLVTPASPPSRRVSAVTPQRSRRRPSEEMDTDSSSAAASRRNGLPSSAPLKDKVRDERDSTRKHRSMGGSISTTASRDKAREARRESVAALSLGSSARATTTKHSRSSSSSSHAGERTHSKRATGTDFSHLPPSPSSSSIQHFLRHPTAAAHAAASPLNASSAVAHSLLRGTQEGWSAMDDEATAETLRKLDGISGKSGSHARSRTSVGSRPPSVSRPGSRPGTPGGTRGSQWEGIAAVEGRSSRSSKKASMRDSLGPGSKEKSGDSDSGGRVGLGLALEDSPTDPGEEPHVTFSPDKLPPKKRSSFVAPKRGSSGSTTYTGTPTTSSRDSGTMSAATSLTSVSAASGRHSVGKARRNSAGSDMSAHSSDVASLRDRVAALASNGELLEGDQVPPVPPLPKNFSNLRSPPQSASGVAFPASNSKAEESDPDRTVSHDIPPVFSSPSKATATPSQRPRTQESSSNQATPSAPKTPSKKWSISSALNLNMRLPGAPSRAAASTQSPVVTSPLSSGFPSKSLDLQVASSAASQRSVEGWTQPAAMASAASLASLSSMGSMRASPSESFMHNIVTSQTPDHTAPSRPETASSASTNQNTGGLAPSQDPLSPSSSSLRRGSSKRLTPSSIPFFRRSSSQSMQVPPGGGPKSASPPAMPAPKPSARLRVKSTMSPPTDSSLSSPATPGTKKSSVLSLGFPSLLRGSSSRKSLHSDKEKSDARSDKEAQRAARDAEKSREKAEKDRKKEDKDRSESRISVLMGRKRGKTVSTSSPKKEKPPTSLPPMQMSAIPPSTAQRVANLKPTPSTPSSSRIASSRVTSQTISSLHKQSDTSLRSSRAQLPTIAGSPSVGTGTTSSQGSLKDNSMAPPSSLGVSVSNSMTKETPTKIPRITGTGTGRSSATASPATLTARRGSLHASALGGASGSTEPAPSPSLTATNDNIMDEFGMLENNENQGSKAVPSTPSHRVSVRGSPSTSSSSFGASTSRVPRQVSAPLGSTRKNRESISFSGLRKASTGSVASMSSTAATTAETTMQRLAALSPSRGLKLLSPKISLASARTFNSSSHSNSNSTSSAHVAAAASSSRQSLNTPSPAPSSVDDEEAAGDEEMLHYIKRQQAKKLANGASQEELDDMLRFPEPLPPVPASSPSAILKSSQVKYLSEYERKEILDYDSVYFFGARSQKKPATPDNSTNNYGYDDDRGDYLIVNHDHLGYRYEVVGSLGKGSFGQVLRCRDHRTGEFVAIKIIRNKKRFHHQALVEIKILDNLRKWDPEDKHQVIKMTEHFNFRGHLCIAMELLSINLYELIKANGFVGFSTSLIRRFTSQMLLSLGLMRQHRIVHCDLKPENVLLKHPAKSGIKVIDFGSSCLEHEKIYTYIQSRFYRSPEVIMGMNYHMAIDMWSLGCIMAELYTGFPIFPGENEQEQLSCIMEVLGVPDKDFINRSSRKKLFFDPSGVPRPVVNSKGRRRRPGTKTLAQVLRCDDELFVDFIAKCLTWDPERRMKPQQALRHPYVLPARRAKITSPVPSSSKSLASTLGSSSRSKPGETPKKSQISAPTPLTARMSRTNSGNVASTPNGSTSMHAVGSTSRGYRASQSQTFSTYHSSRTMTSFAAAK